MSTALRGLRTVIYPAADLTAAKAWWTEYLGFAPYFDEPFYVGFDVAGFELGLLPDGDPTSGPTTYWGVDDVALALDDAEKAGATVRDQPSDVGDGIIVGALTTPDGAVVGLIFNPHFAAGD